MTDILDHIDAAQSGLEFADRELPSFTNYEWVPDTVSIENQSESRRVKDQSGWRKGDIETDKRLVISGVLKIKKDEKPLHKGAMLQAKNTAPSWFEDVTQWSCWFRVEAVRNDDVGLGRALQQSVVLEYSPSRHEEIWLGRLPAADFDSGLSVLQLKALAHFKFDADGTDSTPNGNDLTPQNAPSYVAATVGNAARTLSASSQRFSRASDPSFTPPGAFLSAGIVRVDDLSKFVGIISRHLGPNDRSHILYFNSTSNRFIFLVSGDGTFPGAAELVANTFGPLTEGVDYGVFARFTPGIPDGEIEILVVPMTDAAPNHGNWDSTDLTGGVVHSPASVDLEVGSWDHGASGMGDAHLDEVCLFSGPVTNADIDFIFAEWKAGRSLF